MVVSQVTSLPYYDILYAVVFAKYGKKKTNLAFYEMIFEDPEWGKRK